MSKLSEYKAYFSNKGVDMSNWDKAYQDTIACAEQAKSAGNSIARMDAYLSCRTGKKVRKGG